MTRAVALGENTHILLQNERNARAGRALVPLVKAVAGHPVPAAGGVPRDPALVALAAPVQSEQLFLRWLFRLEACGPMWRS